MTDAAGLFVTVALVQESRQPEHSHATKENRKQGNKSSCIHISSQLFVTVALVQESRQPEHSQETKDDRQQGNKRGCIHMDE